MNNSLSKKILILLIFIAISILIIILINKNKMKEIPISNKDIKLEVGDTQKIIINSNIDVTYKSNNEKIASVSDNGIIYAIHQGFTTITVTSKKNNNVKTVIDVNVIDNSELKVHNIEMISSNKLNKDYIKKGDKLIIRITFNHNLDKKPKLLINSNELTYQYSSNTDYIIIEKTVEDEEELNLNIYIEDKLIKTYQLPKIDNQIPTCTMIYENEILKINSEDNYGIEGYAMSKSKIFVYNSNNELKTNDYGTWYGRIRDYAGNIGECSLKIYEHIDPSNITIIGDSRMEALCTRKWYKQDNGSCIAEVSKGYKWLNSTAIEQVNNLSFDKKRVIVTNLGANDPHNAKKYASKYEELALTTWNDSVLIILSVNPMSGTHSYLNPEINDFNNIMLQLASKYDNIGYCDSNSYLRRNGFESYDGQHYTEKTDKDIYNFTKNCIEDFFKLKSS